LEELCVAQHLDFGDGFVGQWELLVLIVSSTSQMFGKDFYKGYNNILVYKYL
jgi:hypothetical protein